MDPRIESYIRANRKRYTREAINQRLVEAGHDRAAIEATWAALDTRDPDATVGDAFWGRFLLFVVGVNLVALLLVGLVTGMLIGSGGIFILVVLGVALAIGALLAWGIVALTHPTEMGRGTAMAVGGLVPLLFTFLIAGSCYALVGGLTGGMSGPPGPQGTVELDLEPPLELQTSGSVICQPPPGDGSGWSVYSQELVTPDGRLMYVTADSFAFVDGGGDGPAPAPPVDRPSTNLSIGIVQQSESDPPQDWHTGPDTELDADVSPDGLTGTIQFENLTSSAFEEADGLSGTVSWDCTNAGG
jgi:hypothetical protein